MNHLIDGRFWISVLQIQIGATVVILVAACLARFVTNRRIISREWLWHGALVGVLASMLIPMMNRVAPKAGPELAILSVVPATSVASVAQPMVNESIDLAASHQIAQPTFSPPSNLVEFQVETPRVGTELPTQTETIGSSARTSLESRTPVVATPARRGVETRATIWDVMLWMVLFVWCMGVVYHFSRGLVGMVRCRRIVATAIPLDHAQFDDVLLQLKRVLSSATLPPISASSQIGSPAVMGTLRPQIVLPVDALRWMSSTQLFQVLLHEIAHVLRRDPLVNALQFVARALFWHHPLVHWLNRRLSQAREDVCDNFVLTHTGAADYAETLLEMTVKCPRLFPMGALAILPVSGSLEERVTGLLDGSRDRSIRWPLWSKLGIVSILLLVPFCLALIRVTERSIQADEPKPSSKNVKPADQATPSDSSTTAVKETATATTETGPGRISGRVLFDKDGQVAAGATVVLLPPPPKGQGVYYGLLPLKQMVADSNGRFTFESLPPGSYRVWANLGRQTSRKLAKKGVTVNLEEGREPPGPVELRLFDGLSVTAKVVDKATGKIIPNSTVRLGWSDLVGDFHADGDAPVVVQPLTPERWFFEAWADGYAKESRWLNLENGENAAAEFQLVPGGDLSGVVSDPDGKTVEGVGLSVRSDDSPAQIDWVKTDAQGRFRLEHLPFGRGLKIHVSKVDWVPHEFPVQLTASIQNLTVKVVQRPHGGSIEGVVQDSDGRPVANAVLRNEGVSSAEVRETTSDTEGRFKLDNVFRGSTGHDLIIRAPKFAPQRLTVVPGPAKHPKKVTVKLSPGHYRRANHR